MILFLLSVPFDFGLINSFQTALDQRTTISSLPPTPAVSNSRTAGFSIFGFCARVLSGYLFFNASQRLTAADRPRTHSCGCALFLFLRWKHRFLRFFSAEAPTRKPRSGVFLLLDFTLPLKTAILYAVQAQQRLLSGRTYYRFVSFGRIPISKQLFFPLDRWHHKPSGRPRCRLFGTSWKPVWTGKINSILEFMRANLEFIENAWRLDFRFVNGYYF